MTTSLQRTEELPSKFNLAATNRPRREESMIQMTQLKLIKRDGAWAIVCNGKTHQETNRVIVKETKPCNCGSQKPA